MDPHPARYPPSYLAWLMWLLGAGLFLVGFFHRIALGVMTDELTRTFNLTAATLGNLGAFYYYSYVAMQIPTGLLADRLGPRKLLVIGGIIASVGTFLFAFADSLWTASLGRLLIGGSVAVAFVTMMKIANHWFPLQRFALLTGLALFAGVVGGLFAGVPLQSLILDFGWRSIMAFIATTTALLAVVTLYFIRNDPNELGFKSYYRNSPAKNSDTHKVSALAGIKKVSRIKNTWLLMLAPGAMAGTVLSFAGLWGVPFLTTQYEFTLAEAATINAAIMLAWAIGGPLLGYLSDRLGRRKPIYFWGAVLAALCWGFATQIENLSPELLIFLLVFGSFCCGVMIIGFAYAKESVPSNFSGTVSGVCNMGVMLGPMILQPGIGILLDLNWGGVEIEAVRQYDFNAYQIGFRGIVAWLLLAAICLAFTRETHCRESSAT